MTNHASSIPNNDTDTVRPRLPLGALDYQVPPVAGRLPYFLGGLTLTAFVLLGLTGLLLTQLYSPGPLDAHASVQYTMTQVPLGGWLRSLHAWSAWLMAFAVTAHLAWIIWRGSYRRPRELTYYTGLVSLATVFLLYFTGTTLPNDQAGAEALAHAVTAAEMTSPAGAPLTPGFSAVPLLTRLYALHVAVLPLRLVILVAAHLWLIRHLEISTWPGEARGGAIFRQHLWRLGATASWMAALTCLLAWLLPAELGYPAVAGAEVTKPPFFFLWIYALENWFGSAALVAGPAAAAVVLLALPWIDRAPSPRATERPLAVGLGLGALAILLTLALIAYLAPAQQHLMN
ncbi:MAG: cytochrome b N-terminal domain-containing protein [Acidobacteriota bacterium]